MVGYGSYSDLNVHVKRDCICLLNGNGKTLKEVIGLEWITRDSSCAVIIIIIIIIILPSVAIGWQVR